MNRKLYYWKLRNSELQLGERTLLMGILNVTPDSFSDGGNFLDPDRAYARALEMEEQGADIIDIGAESTRPDSKRISMDEEWQRLLPVLKKLRDKLGVPISLDTYKAEIVERALEYGIEIVNDPSGLTLDADLAKAVVRGDTGLILNHMRGTPETWGGLPPLSDPAGAVGKDLDAAIGRARMAGVDRNRIAIDPGLGFGKRKEQNSDILAQLTRLAALDCPILVGASRKSFLSILVGGESLFATAAAVTAAILNGAHIVRIHDVTEMRAVAAVADEIARMAAIAAARAEEEEEARKAAKTARSAPKSLPPYLAEKKSQPTRPPLMKVEKKEEPAPVVSPVVDVEPVETEAAMPAESPAAETPDAAESVAAVKPEPTPAPAKKRPPQTEPSKGWDAPPSQAPGHDRPARFAADSGGDRGVPRRSFRDGPPSPRREFGGGQGRPRPSFGGGPKFGDRPPRDSDRRDGPPSDRRPREGRPADSGPGERRPFAPRPGGARPGGARPGGARPPFGGPRDGRPSFGKPFGARPGAGKPGAGRPAGTSSFGPPRAGRPGDDRTRDDRPRRSGPGDDRKPPSGPGKRPFRKRP